MNNKKTFGDVLRDNLQKILLVIVSILFVIGRCTSKYFELFFTTTLAIIHVNTDMIASIIDVALEK